MKKKPTEDPVQKKIAAVQKNSINSEDTLPLMLAPVKQIGLQIAFGMRGFPSNRIVMAYGPPGGGKSSLMFSITGEYLQNEDEVWIRETEHALDRIYFASYLHCPLTGDDLIREALTYWRKKTIQRLTKEDKLSDEERTIAPEALVIMNQRVEEIPRILEEIKKEIPAEDRFLPPQRRKDIIRLGIAEYKLRNVSIEHPRTLEEFEAKTISDIEAKQADPARRFKRLFIGVDSINYLLPKEDIEKATSSDGRSLMSAKYLHMMLPRLLGKISGHEITLFFISQQTTYIKMNPYESTSEIGSVQGRGGLALKFGATFMIGVEQRAKTTNMTGNEVKTGILKIPKAKLRFGGQGPGEGKFYLQEGVKTSAMTFNEPLLMEVLNEEKLGIQKKRGRNYIPGKLLKSHPRFEADILPKLKPIPKKKEEEEEDGSQQEQIMETVPELETVKVIVPVTEGITETKTEKLSLEGLFYSGYPAEIIPILLETPKFHEAMYDLYDVVEPV